MDNYLGQVNRLKDIFLKCNYEQGIKYCLQQGEDEGLNVGIVGVNIIEHLGLIKKLNSDTTNIKYTSLNLMNGKADSDNISCDMVIQVIDAVQPVSKGDYNLYSNLSKHYNNIIFVVCRLNYADDDEIDDVKSYIEEKLKAFNGNEKLFYIDEESSFNYLIDYLEAISINDSFKNNASNFKLNALCEDGIIFIGENINLLENWEVEKQKKIKAMNNEITKLYSYGEGLALYFMRYKERVEKYISTFGQDDTRYIQKSLNDLASFVEGSFRKHLKVNIEGIKDLNVQDVKYTASPYFFIEYIRVLINKNLHQLINEINRDIEDLNNKSKDIGHLDTLKECYKEVLRIREDIGDE